MVPNSNCICLSLAANGERNDDRSRLADGGGGDGMTGLRDPFIKSTTGVVITWISKFNSSYLSYTDEKFT